MPSCLKTSGNTVTYQAVDLSIYTMVLDRNSTELQLKPPAGRLIWHRRRPGALNQLRRFRTINITTKILLRPAPDARIPTRSARARSEVIVAFPDQAATCVLPGTFLDEPGKERLLYWSVRHNSPKTKRRLHMCTLPYPHSGSER